MNPVHRLAREWYMAQLWLAMGDDHLVSQLHILTHRRSAKPWDLAQSLPSPAH